MLVRYLPSLLFVVSAVAYAAALVLPDVPASYARFAGTVGALVACLLFAWVMHADVLEMERLHRRLRNGLPQPPPDPLSASSPAAAGRGSAPGSGSAAAAPR